MAPDSGSTNAVPESPAEDPSETSCFGVDSELSILFLPVAKRKKKTIFTFFFCFVTEKNNIIIKE